MKVKWKKMKPEQLFEELKELAEKLEITVSEQNFRNTGIKVKSGLARVKGKEVYYLDKHLSIFKKNQLIAECIAQKPLDHIFIVPVLREFLKKFIKEERDIEN